MGSVQSQEIANGQDDKEVDAVETYVHIEKVDGQKTFKTCDVCGPDFRAHGYCLNCVEYLCAECVRAHGNILATRKHSVTVIQKLVKLHKKEPKKDNIATCDACGPETYATVHCAECSEFFCSSCLLDHRRVNLTKNHKVTKVEEFSMSTDPSQTFMCKAHNKIAVCTCSTCDNVRICQLCLSEHYEHDFSLPDNLQLYLPILTGYLRKHEQQIDNIIEVINWRRWSIDYHTKKEPSNLKSRVYDERKCTEEQEKDYYTDFNKIMQKVLNKVAVLEKDLVELKASGMMIMKRYEDYKQGDQSQLKDIYTDFLQLFSEDLPHKVPRVWPNDVEKLRTEYRDSLPYNHREYRSYFKRRRPSTESDESEDEECKEEDEDKEDTLMEQGERDVKDENDMEEEKERKNEEEEKIEDKGEDEREDDNMEED